MVGALHSRRCYSEPRNGTQRFRRFSERQIQGLRWAGEVLWETTWLSKRGPARSGPPGRAKDRGGLLTTTVGAARSGDRKRQTHKEWRVQGKTIRGWAENRGGESVCTREGCPGETGWPDTGSGGRLPTWYLFEIYIICLKINRNYFFTSLLKQNGAPPQWPERPHLPSSRLRSH